MSLASCNEAEPHYGPFRRLSSTAEPVAGLRPILEQTVARVFDVDTALMRRPTRGRAQVALARQVTMYLAHVAAALA
jgi:hypothetical protein